MIKKIGAFVEDRTGVRGLLADLFEEQVDGGASWARVFGNALLILFVVEAVTGALLSLTYSPSVDSAWASVFSIQHQVTHGWFIRGLHNYAAQAMLIIVGVHILVTVLYGAYKKPHEFNWWITLGLAGTILGMLLTGMRLPWDQHSYWALQVELNIAGAAPVVGEATNDLVAGAPMMGQNTLTRLYTAHLILIPGAMMLLFALRYGLRRRNGWPTMNFSDARPDGDRLSQLVRDVAFVVLVLAAVAVFTSLTGGSDLYAPAEPDKDFPARPEWFLLPLYKLRMLIPPSTEMLATMVLPAVLGGFMFMLPLLDRKPGGGILKRLVWLVPVVLIFVGGGALTMKSQADDAADEDHQAALTFAHKRAERSVELARNGIPPEGPVAMLRNDPMTQGADVYAQYCTGCHILDGEGEQKAPDHTGFASREWILSLIYAPRDDHFFGQAEMSERMPSQWRVGEEDLTMISAFLFSLGREAQDPAIDQAEADEGEALFKRKCMNCHIYEGDGDFNGLGGPNLTFYASRTWIYRQTAHPGSDTQYGALNEMPEFFDQLSRHDLRMVTAFLRQQRFQEIDFEIERRTE